MRVLVLSQYYPPEGALIPSAIAEGLSGRGYKVKVLTGFPNYPEGELFEGYEMKWREKSRHGEVEVLRVPHYANHSEHAIRTSLNYVSFGLSAATARRYARDADVIYVYATQMTPALGPWLWKITGGAPYVLHVQDLWPDSITGSSLVKGGLAPRVVDVRFIAGGYGLADERVNDAVALGWKNGLRLDPLYIGKAFSGLISYARSGELGGKKVLFWHTGGLWNFLSGF